MNFTTIGRITIPLMLCALAAEAWALDASVPGIEGDISRALLGDGTGVVVGIVDSGVDDTHPALAGVDSLGNLRMLAEANFVTTEPANTGDDVFGHGTWVTSTVLSDDGTYTGMAPDARFINARVLNNGNSFFTDTWVRNGVGYAVDQGANIINLSLNFFAPTSSGNSQLDLMIDWAAYARGISTTIAAGNISGGNGSQAVRGPGSAYNGITVGRTTADLSKVHTDSAVAYTADGRMKPDVVAPGSGLTLANDDWEGVASDWDTGLNGTSFAAPHVAGLLAQLLDAGTTLGYSTNPLVVKAAIMNSAGKSVLDRSFNPWAPASVANVAGVTTVSQPLDTDSGAGLINGLATAEQYLAGELSPGFVASIGWDLNAVAGGQFVDYIIDPGLAAGSALTATLTWHRHVGLSDNGNGAVDAGDTFFLEQALSNLNLQVLRNGTLVAQSVSTVDNVEHLFFDIDRSARYTLRVIGATVGGGSEQFALAWRGVALPEPASFVLVLLSTIGPLMLRPRHRALEAKARIDFPKDSSRALTNRRGAE
jgi:hypothetical protein